MEKQERRYGNQVVLLEGAALGADLRYTPGGLAVLTFTVGAQTRGEEGPVYIPVRVLGKRAEALAEALEAPVGVFVVGTVETYRPEGGGERHSVLAERVRVFALAEEDLTPPDGKGQRRMKGGLSLFAGVGNLARPVEVSRGGSTPFARSVLAVSRTEDQADFVPFVAFGALAEALEGLDKGTPLYLRGRLVHDSWTTQSGERRFGLRVEAEAVRRRRKEGREKPLPKLAEEADFPDFPEDLPF
ncbi:Single-stranded DNA-binding protein [bacterium HR39]|nr:Single-stranded DNA-binding protein [bacterium HR39]